MKLHTGRRIAAAALVSTVGLGGLMAMPSPAHAAITNGGVAASAGGHDDESCDATAAPSAPDPAALTDNNVPVTQSASATVTVTDPGNTADVTDLSSSSTITAKASPIGAGPAQITVSGSASARATPRLATTVCDGHAFSGAGADFSFKLTAPLWVTISGSGAGSGSGGGNVSIGSDNTAVGLTVGPRTSGSATALLPAGDYYFSAEVGVDARGANTVTPRSSSIAATFAVSMTPVGAAGPVVGKGAKFVSFGERNCANNSVTAAFGKALKKKAKAVKVTVNGAKRLTITKAKKLKRTRSVVLGGIAPTAPATVAATVTLKNGKKVTVSRSYLACS